MKFKYENGDKLSCGPSYQRGGYAKYNWCGKCTAVWDKTYNRCGVCNSKLRASRKRNRQSVSRRKENEQLQR